MPVADKLVFLLVAKILIYPNLYQAATIFIELAGVIVNKCIGAFTYHFSTLLRCFQIPVFVCVLICFLQKILVARKLLCQVL